MCQHSIDCNILLTAQLLTVPEELKVYKDEDPDDLGVWKMNIEWKDGVPNSIKPDRVTYDINIFYAEQTNKTVHNVSFFMQIFTYVYIMQIFYSYFNYSVQNVGVLIP